MHRPGVPGHPLARRSSNILSSGANRHCTTIDTCAMVLAAPLVAVTVTTYVPGVVPASLGVGVGVTGADDEEPPPPQPVSPLSNAQPSTSPRLIARSDRRAGSMHASNTPASQ